MLIRLLIAVENYLIKNNKSDSELCNKIELMLYSQKEQNVFDLAYACGQATELYNHCLEELLRH